MDAVQRAYESQVRREERKRLQLQNAVLLEEDKRRRELEKDEKEQVRERMIAAQHLQRMQNQEFQRQDRQRKAAALTENKNALMIQSQMQLHDREAYADMKQNYIHHARSVADYMDHYKSSGQETHRALVQQGAGGGHEERRARAELQEQSRHMHTMHASYLRHQALQLAKERAVSQDTHRAVIYQRAREEEAMRCQHQQQKIEAKEERSEAVQAQKMYNIELQKHQLQMRAAEIHRKVKTRESELMMYRYQQADKYEAKRQKAEWLESEKLRMMKEMQQRRQHLSQDEEMFNAALHDIRYSKNVDDMGLWVRRVRDAAHVSPRPAAPPRDSPHYHHHHRPTHHFHSPRLEYKPPPRPPPSPSPAPAAGAHKPRAQSASRTARKSMSETYADTTRSMTPRRPTTARPGGPKVTAREQELESKIIEEQKREMEREGILRQVSDPRQRARLHKLFAIERQQAKQTILRLQMNI